MLTIYYVVYHDLFFQHVEQLTAKNVNEKKMMPPTNCHRSFSIEKVLMGFGCFPFWYTIYVYDLVIERKVFFTNWDLCMVKIFTEFDGLGAES